MKILSQVIEPMIVAVAILIVGMIFGYMSGKDHSEVITQVEERVEYVEVPKYEYKTIEVEVERIPETKLTKEEKGLIAGVVYAEAGNQDMIGKRLVVDAILNRVGRKGFADTVAGVITQPGQFAYSGSYTEECVKAVEMECMERLDNRVIWFCNSGFMPYGVPAYRHGDHWFNWIDDIPMGGAGAQEVLE